MLLTAHAAACSVVLQRTVPFMPLGGLMMVPLTVNGTTLAFVLDTGAARTVISEPAARAIHLARDEWVSTDMQGIGGRERSRLGRPTSVVLAGLPLFRHTMASDNTIAVGSLPGGAGGQPIDGLLGQDFLSGYDLDLDPVGRTASLYSVAGCSGAFLPWREPYDVIPAIRVGTRLIVPVHIGGQELRAELDTGAQRTTLMASGIGRLGMLPGGLLALQGFGPGSQTARLQRFDRVHIGPDTFDGMPIFVTPARIGNATDMLLGADWIGSRRSWVSWATDQVMVAGALPPPASRDTDTHMHRIGP